jgi:inosine-uridine nucleoside N-ribohydrolase
MWLRVALLVLLCSVNAVCRNHPAIVTTDCGAEVDDQFALAWLLTSPDIDLKGIVTTHAPNLQAPASETSAQCARQMVKLAGARARVFAGSPVPLDRFPRPLMNDGVQFILGMSRGYSHSNRLPVLSIGAATDIASALLADRDLANRIEIMVMGFNDWPDGGDPWNVKNDPAAFQVILDSDVPLTVGTTYITRQYLAVNASIVRQIAGGAGPLGDFLVETFETWLKRNAAMASQVAGPGAWVLWDMVAPAHLLGLTRTKDVDRPMLDTSTLQLLHPPTTRKVRWIAWIDRDRVFTDFRKNLK